MRTVRDNIWLCPDCMIASLNGDTSGVKSPERVAAIDAGLNRLGRGLVPDFTGEYEDGHEEFMPAPVLGCGCCRSHLAGSFYRFALLER